MKRYLAVFLTSFAISGFCSEVSSIKEIVLASSPKEDHFMLMNSGHVIFISQKDKELLEKYKRFYRNRTSFYFPVSENRSKLLSQDPVPENIQKEFDLMNPNWKSEGQCHDKAHVWVYEAHKRGVSMNKLFLFFTKDYIRRYRFGWWFHVAPIMKEEGKTFIMDQAFLDVPSSIKSWTDLFIETRKACSKIKYYSTYEQNKWKKDCYLIETSKYIRQPSHIKNKSQRKVFYMQEIRNAYRRAFEKM